MTLRRFRPLLPLLCVLAIGLVFRLLLWGRVPRTGLISDEGEYLAAATWLAQGRNFAWYNGYLWTRAPLYPLFVAAHIAVFGRAEAVYVTQTVISLINVAQVYVLALQLGPAGDTTAQRGALQVAGGGSRLRVAVATIAALLMALYLPFALYPQVLLSETLFIALLLGSFLALARYCRLQIADCRLQRFSFLSLIKHPTAMLIVAGVLLGLATLTRSLTLGFLPLVALWLGARGWELGAGKARGLESGVRGQEAASQVRGQGSQAASPTNSPARQHRETLPTDDGQPPTDDGQPTTDNGQSTTDDEQRIAGKPAFLSSSVSRLSSRIRHVAILLVAAFAIILPWTVYNSRLYGGLVFIDTTGAFNLMLGARTAHDGRRADAPPRNFVLALLAQLPEAERRSYQAARLDQGGACIASQRDGQFTTALARAPVPQAEVQRLMLAEGFCLIQRKPLAFLAKTAGELRDFFQINYSGDERFTNNFTTGRLPLWYTLALFLLDDTLYVLVLPLAALGVGLQMGRRTTDDGLLTLILLWFGFNIAVAPVLFAINRFRLPLLPFAFVFAAYALVRLPGVARSWWRSPAGLTAGIIALALLLVAATPYAYVEPRAPGADAQSASYLGPYPSSIDSTFKALTARPDFLRQEQMRLALREGDVATAQAARPGEIRMQRLGKTAALTNTVLVDALFAAAAGRPAAGLALLPPEASISAARDVEAAVVRGDLLRSLGRMSEANATLGQTFVDNANPVEWAWDWLAPAPTNSINIGGNTDIGYLRGCYLGEGEADANYRWCTDGSQLRFPQGGTGTAQMLRLRADGRGWRGHATAVPPVRVLLNGAEVGRFTPSMDGGQIFTVALPATPKGQTILLTLHTPTFIDSAADYNRQQGPLAGQVRQLGVRLDWVEVR